LDTECSSAIQKVAGKFKTEGSVKDEDVQKFKPRRRCRQKLRCPKFQETGMRIFSLLVSIS